MAEAIYGKRDRTVRDSVQLLGEFDYFDVTLAVAGTAEQLWDVDKSKMEEGRYVRLEVVGATLDALIAFNLTSGDLTEGGNSVRIVAGQVWESPKAGLILSSLRFKNADAAEQPQVRGVIAGV